MNFQDSRHLVLTQLQVLCVLTETSHTIMRCCLQIIHIHVHFNYSRPRIAPAIAEDCYILAVFYLFSHHRFFDVPGPIFAKLYHTTRCVLKYLSPIWVFMCPLKV